MSLKYTCFNTESGWIAAIGSPDGLCRITFPLADRQSAINAVTTGLIAERKESDFLEVTNALVNYFRGKKVEFGFPLDLELEGSTPFQRDVWKATSKIPYGQLRSYGWVAAEIGRPKAARAVGQALGANRIPIIIPCHRVLRSDGSLGGFSAGLNWKTELIDLEKAVFIS